MLRILRLIFHNQLALSKFRRLQYPIKWHQWCKITDRKKEQANREALGKRLLCLVNKRKLKEHFTRFAKKKSLGKLLPQPSKNSKNATQRMITVIWRISLCLNLKIFSLFSPLRPITRSTICIILHIIRKPSPITVNQLNSNWDWESNSLGQCFWSAHCLDWSRFPWQSFPPCCGGGLVQVLCWVW